MSHAPAKAWLVVNGTPLGDATSNWISEIKLEQKSDGADILTLVVDAWDPIRAIFRMLDERPLFPGNKIELWAGYPGSGYPDVCKGLFHMHSREPEYSAQGVVCTFIGYDSLFKFAKANQARVFHKYTRDSDAVRYLVTDPVWGYNLDASFVPALPLLPTAPVNAPWTPDLPAIADSPIQKGDRIKPRNMSDLAWIKRMAEGFGWAYPKIRYQNGRETFVLRPAVTGPDAWTQTFWWRKPGSPQQSDLLSFSTAFAAEAPTGIEIVGWDRQKGVPIRVVALVTPGGEPEVTFDNDVVAGEKVKGSIRSGAKLQMSILGTGERTVKLRRTKYAGLTWTPEKNVQEALTIDMIPGNPEWDQNDLEDIARTWLHQTESAWFTCQAELANQPGLHLVDSDQVHQFRGLVPMDEGNYIMTRATHTWNRRQHRVSLEGQKLIEAEQLQFYRQKAE